MFLNPFSNVLNKELLNKEYKTYHLFESYDNHYFRIFLKYSSFPAISVSKMKNPILAGGARGRIK